MFGENDYSFGAVFCQSSVPFAAWRCQEWLFLIFPAGVSQIDEVNWETKIVIKHGTFMPRRTVSPACGVQQVEARLTMVAVIQGSVFRTVPFCTLKPSTCWCLGPVL